MRQRVHASLAVGRRGGKLCGARSGHCLDAGPRQPSQWCWACCASGWRWRGTGSFCWTATRPSAATPRSRLGCVWGKWPRPSRCRCRRCFPGSTTHRASWRASTPMGAAETFSARCNRRWTLIPRARWCRSPWPMPRARWCFPAWSATASRWRGFRSVTASISRSMRASRCRACSLAGPCAGACRRSGPSSSAGGCTATVGSSAFWCCPFPRIT